MLTIDYTIKNGWDIPIIKPTQPFTLEPATSGLHYGIQIFEGMRAFRNNDNVYIFKPEEHIERFLKSAKRMCLPMFDKLELLKCISELIKIDQNWCPNKKEMSLYIRPFMFGTDPTLGLKPTNYAKLAVILSPVGSYFEGNFKKGVSLFATSEYIRSWPGGIGDCKTGCNYGPTLQIQKIAKEKYNCDQILWLYNNEITECGSMNFFVFLKDSNNKYELVTPKLNQLILPGITRNCVLQLTKEWNKFKVSERKLTLSELLNASKENKIIEMFGTGTSVVIFPIKKILYQNNIIEIKSNFSLASKLYKTLKIPNEKLIKKWNCLKISKI